MEKGLSKEDIEKAEQAINKLEGLIVESGGTPVLFKEIFDAIKEWNKEDSLLLDLLSPAFGKRDVLAIQLYWQLLYVKSSLQSVQGMLILEMQHEDHHKGYDTILIAIEKYINMWNYAEEDKRKFWGMSRNRVVREIVPQFIEHVNRYHALLRELKEIIIKIKKLEEEKIMKSK